MSPNSGPYKAPQQFRSGPRFRVYLLDLWCFIPYYIVALCKALRKNNIESVLGSVRYHLDRRFFRTIGIEPDPYLLDFGGGIKAKLLQRIVKSLEYFTNLFVLTLRLSFSKIDVLHVQFLPFLERGYPFEIWFLNWIRARGTKIVCTVHNLSDRDARAGSRQQLLRLYSLANAIICHGYEAQQKLSADFEVPVKKIRCIPHGPLFTEQIDESKAVACKKLGLPDDEIIVLCAGVISEYKGIPFLLDAWKQCCNTGTKCRLVIAGTGDSSLLAQIRKQVEQERLESSVTLWLRFIEVKDLPVLHRAADILVYPYKAGTTSGALLTGLSFNKPIISTKLPFFREHLSEGSEALMAEYGDVQVLAHLLTQLINDPEKRERMSAALAQRPKVEDPWNEIARSTINCYRHVLEQDCL